MSTKNISSNMSTHAGHRERMRERFNKGLGVDFADHELLEMLLFYSIPRENTNGTAHDLINKFGSLKAVLNADPNFLEQVDGVGSSTSTLISLIKEINNRIRMDKYDLKRFTADSLEKVGNFLVDYYKNSEHEELCVLFLNNSLKLIEFKSVSNGSASSTCADISSIARHALGINATYLILAHNHPHGIASPSSDDKSFSILLDSALRPLNIRLVDHVVVSGDSYSPTLHTKALEQGRKGNPLIYNYFYGE